MKATPSDTTSLAATAIAVAKIPIAGFFFKNEGYSDENETLMILIRAHITDVQDELARLERTAR